MCAYVLCVPWNGRNNDQSPYPLFCLHHLYKMYIVVCTYIIFYRIFLSSVPLLLKNSLSQTLNPTVKFWPCPYYIRLMLLWHDVLYSWKKSIKPLNVLTFLLFQLFCVHNTKYCVVLGLVVGADTNKKNKPGKEQVSVFGFMFRRMSTSTS